MFYSPYCLANSSSFPGNKPPTIQIFITDENWDTAFSNYLSGKVPTESIEWKCGVFLWFLEVYGPFPSVTNSAGRY